MDPNATRVLEFWFNRPPIDWIIAPPGLDDEIATHFSALVSQALSGALTPWTADPKSTVALVVLLDQFPRNLHRGTPKAFSGDAQARDVAARAIARGFDTAAGVSVVMATALYMPLMQAETLVSVIAARALLEGLKTRCASEEEHEWVGGAVEAAGRHLVQIERFGRYPSRNKVLGRETTADEERFLREREGVV